MAKNFRHSLWANLSILFLIKYNMNNRNIIIRSIAIVFALLISLSTANAQSVAGRIAFGIDAGGNKYYGDFTDNQFAFHGDAFIRWNILDFLSLHAAYNGGQLKYKATKTGADYENTYQPGIQTVGELNHTRVGGGGISCSHTMYSLKKHLYPM